ncbi:inositol monophosphatase family protein [Siphonobacter curvatus]|uniref:Inositol-1-monophosphatase n=1 Tax=Siphonobacter curvatus TaxID=2094562 RepID=A0A2S7IRJ5_9BACT|nr:inositol monophosphatase family protein [Siphonobacter curvatus]PQA60289.1 inositol monophosphatase [Siphonobacter curvatus]
MSFEKITLEVTQLAKAAGEFMLAELKHFDPTKIEHKYGENFNLVSYVDKETESRLVEGLSGLLPGSGFITEEGTVEQATDQEFVWVIDPLDGTTNFLHAYPQFCTSIGLLQGGKPVAGIIYEPFRDEMFYTWKDGGAWLNKERLSVSKVDRVQSSLLACGFPSRQNQKTEAYMNMILRITKESHGFRRIGSAALDLAYTARGWFEGYFEYNINSWDIAAGILLVQEAGGTVTDFKGEENYLFGGEIISSNGRIHQELIDMISESMA